MQDWELLEETVLYEKFRRLISRKYRLPNGTEHDFEIMDNPDSVAVFALTPDNQVVLARQFRPGPQVQLNELPGGILDAGEDPLTAGLRELREETGYTGEGTYLGSTWYSSYACGKRHTVLVRNCVLGERELEATEDVTVALSSIAEVRDQALKGDMTDAGSALRCLGYLGELEEGV